MLGAGLVAAGVRGGTGALGAGALDAVATGVESGLAAGLSAGAPEVPPAAVLSMPAPTPVANPLDL